jgi:S-DNA-T family DNA segregation ATPase FtsK/SpoIIIE
MGKISTSLLQRRLEIGYGRAAKIIDRMEALGYVSAPDGNKPRVVLVSKASMMEKRLNDEE